MVTFYTPRLHELDFRRTLLGDAETMHFNHAYGGTVSFPPEDWQEWYARWITDCGSERFYRYVVNDEGDFVGEACYHWDANYGVYITDVLIYAPCRRHGYGRAALLLLCDAAKQNGIDCLYDDIAIDNPSVSLFLRCGFTETERTDTYIMVKKSLTDKNS